MATHDQASDQSVSTPLELLLTILFYHINCDVIQGFPALRKAVTIHVSNILNDFLKCRLEQSEIVRDFCVIGILCRYHTMGYFNA